MKEDNLNNLFYKKKKNANLSVSEKVSCYMNFINKTEVAKERFGMKASFKTVLNLFLIAF